MERTICSFCHEECRLSNVKIKKDAAGRQYICYKCYRKTGIDNFLQVAKMTVDELKPYIDEANESYLRRKEINPDIFVKGLLEADRRKKLWSTPKGGLINESPVHEFCDIISYSLRIDGAEYGKAEIAQKLTENSLFSAPKLPKSGGLFKAKQPKCGGMSIAINIDSLIQPRLDIVLLDSAAAYDSAAFSDAVQSAEQCISLLDYMMKNG